MPQFYIFIWGKAPKPPLPLILILFDWRQAPKHQFHFIINNFYTKTQIFFFNIEKNIVQKLCVHLLLEKPFFQSKYSTYCTPNKEIKIDVREQKNAILSDSSADLFSHGCQQEHKGLVEESKVRPHIYILFSLV